MLRRAIINHLQNSISELDNRVFQAFLAPVGCGRPFATVKLASQKGSSKINFAGHQVIQVYLYNDPDSFLNLDMLEGEVIGALTRGDITDAETGNKFSLGWSPGAGDFVDSEKGLVGRMVSFEVALLRAKE